jgi:hypothetical protein
VASEAAIASNLVHHNVVATYSHDICNVSPSTGIELPVFKFYLIQVQFLDDVPLLLSPASAPHLAHTAASLQFLSSVLLTMSNWELRTESREWCQVAHRA